MLLRRLMLVIHMTGNAPRRRSGKRMMARNMPNDPAGNGPADTAFGLGRRSNSKAGRRGNEKCNMKVTHKLPPF